MSTVESGLNNGAAFLNNAYAEILAGMGKLSTEDFAARLLEKLIADGFLELKPGCTKEQTANIFASAFNMLKLKLPANI